MTTIVIDDSEVRFSIRGLGDSPSQVAVIATCDSNDNNQKGNDSNLFHTANAKLTVGVPLNLPRILYCHKKFMNGKDLSSLYIIGDK